MKIAAFCIVGGASLLVYSVLGIWGGLGAALLSLGYVIIRGKALLPSLEFELKRNEIGLIALQDQLEVTREKDKLGLEMMKRQAELSLQLLKSQQVSIDASTQMTYQQTEVLEKQADLLNQAKNRMRDDEQS